MMKATVAMIVYQVLLLAGVVLLQVFLSRRESRWPGLVLPGLAFAFSFLFPLNLAGPADILLILLVWLAGNIPTLIFLAVYFSCRGKARRKKQMEKMSIQDLD